MNPCPAPLAASAGDFVFKVSVCLVYACNKLSEFHWEKEAFLDLQR
jgi:hypothetical protein